MGQHLAYASIQKSSFHTFNWILSGIWKTCCTKYVPTGEIDGILLGDTGYPCYPHYSHLPWPWPRTSTTFQSLTVRQKEITKGQLKAHFQWLRHLRVTPEWACDIIVACVVLHNIAIIRATPCPTNRQTSTRLDRPCRSAEWQTSQSHHMPNNFHQLNHHHHHHNQSFEINTFTHFNCSSLFPATTNITTNFSWVIFRGITGTMILHSIYDTHF